jgi:tRNA modification GTPase
MLGTDLNDTITAIGTPVGEAGIGIVRISGKDALKIADKIFVSKDGKKPSTFKTYTTHYGWVVENSEPRTLSPELRTPDTEQRTLNTEHRKVIDEVLLTVMRAPRSYTKEDVIEINCHGGIVALRRVLDLVLESGARLAEPGEFTRRAFLNGRIDLAQAESVLDIIRAKTDSALKISTEQLRGVLSQELNKIGKILLEMLSILETNIDFPEEEIEEADLNRARQELEDLGRRLRGILDTSRQGRVLREGIKVVICGKPNVGKSSLLNALLKEERSIVTPVAGTTRDTIEEVIDIRGVPIRIVDTAGIIEPRDLVEKKAVQRSKKYIAQADLAILLFDGSRKLSREDDLLIIKLKKKAVLAVVNKIDLKQKIERAKIGKKFASVIEISAKKAKNIKSLEDAIADLAYGGKIKASESILVSNQRHIQSIREAQKLIAEAVNSLDNKLSPEFIAQAVKEALGHIDEILGRRFSEGLLDKIFSEFCIGK